MLCLWIFFHVLLLKTIEGLQTVTNNNKYHQYNDPAFVRKVTDINPIIMPQAIAVDSSGNIYFTDGRRVRMISMADPSTIHIIAGNFHKFRDDAGDGGPATSATFNTNRNGLYVSRITGEIYFTSGTSVRIISNATSATANRTIDTIAGKCRTGAMYSADLAINACLPPLQNMVGDPRTDTLYLQALIHDNYRHENRSRDFAYHIFKFSTKKGWIRSIFHSSEQTFYLSSFHHFNWAGKGFKKHHGGTLYLAEHTSSYVFALSASDGRYLGFVAGSGKLGTFGDNGPATSAGLLHPYGTSIAPKPDGSHVMYIADAVNGRIRKVDLSSGIISTIVGYGEIAPRYSDSFSMIYSHGGDGGPGTNAFVSSPIDMHFVRSNDGVDAIYIAEYHSNVIRKVTFTSRNHTDTIVTTVAGTISPIATNKQENVSATSAYIDCPSSVVVDKSRNLLYYYELQRIRCVDLSTGLVNTVINTDPDYRSSVTALTIDSAGDIYYNEDYLYVINKVSTSQYPNGSVTIERIAGTGKIGSLIPILEGKILYANNTTALPAIGDITLDKSMNILYVSACDDGIIFSIDLSTKLITIIAGIGPYQYDLVVNEADFITQNTLTMMADAALLYNLWGMWFDNKTNSLYFTERYTWSRIRRVDLNSRLIKTVVVFDIGNWIRTLEGDPAGNVLYALEERCGYLLTVSLLNDSYGNVTTIAGKDSYIGVTGMPSDGIVKGTDTHLSYPMFMTYDPVTRSIYFIDGDFSIYQLYFLSDVNAMLKLAREAGAKVNAWKREWNTQLENVHRLNPKHLRH